MPFRPVVETKLRSLILGVGAKLATANVETVTTGGTTTAMENASMAAAMATVTATVTATVAAATATAAMVASAAKTMTATEVADGVSAGSVIESVSSPRINNCVRWVIDMTNQVMDLFEPDKFVKVCAPMVRYSKLPFRLLVRKYNCDLCFTPMILADSFVQSELARNSEFSTCDGDQPLIVQFAANNPHDFSTAAEMVAPFSNGVDLNCGCPQRWAMKEGYGAHLLRNPELIRDLVLQVRNKIPQPFTVSVKIRILDEIRRSVDLCQKLEAAGVSFITVHARTPDQRHQPINVSALETIEASVQLPLIANGDVKTLGDAKDLHKKTKCQGVMTARGILTNPALFTGCPVTPLECVAQWVAMGQQFEQSFQIFHHHLSYMLEKIMRKRDRVLFSCLKNMADSKSFLEDYFHVDFSQTRCSLSVIEKCDDSSIVNKLKQRNKDQLDSCEDILINTHLFSE